MFGEAGGVGHTLRLGQQTYRVAGVVGHWNPQPHFYAGANLYDVSYRGDAPDIYLPFRSAINNQLVGTGGYECLPDEDGGDWATRLRSECNWIDVWVQLRTPAEVNAYQSYLDGYAAEQQRSGRWAWSPNVRLRNLTQWLDYVHAVPYEVSIAFALAVGLQLVCLINVIGLLLAKFMRRGLEIGVRRALGASSAAIARQFLVEGAIVGLAGAALGVLLTVLGVLAAGAVFQPRIARLIHVDATLFGLVLLSALLTALLAATYPTWRASRVQPAWQLKAN
jgi:putative ABC transport system permease protein